MVRAHDEDTLDRYEDVRFISFCTLQPYMDKGTSLEKFWPIPQRDNRAEDPEKRSQAKKLMDEVTEKYRQYYNRE